MSFCASCHLNAYDTHLKTTHIVVFILYVGMTLVVDHKLSDDLSIGNRKFIPFIHMNIIWYGNLYNEPVNYLSK